MDSRTLATRAAVVVGLAAMVTMAVESIRIANDIHRGADALMMLAQAPQAGDSPIRIRGGSVLVDAAANSWQCDTPSTCITNGITVPLGVLYFTSRNTIPLVSSRTLLPPNWTVRVDTMPYNTALAKSSPGTITLRARNGQLHVSSSKSLVKISSVPNRPLIRFSDSDCAGCNFQLHTIHIAGSDLDCTNGQCEIDIGP